MVGHESVDPKPQEKSDLVNGVIYCFVCFFVREKSDIYREKKHWKNEEERDVKISSFRKMKCFGFLCFFAPISRRNTPTFIRGACLVKAKGNPVLIPEPGCGYVRRTTN